MNQYINQRKITAILTLIVLLFIVQWLFTHSIVTISTENKDNGSLSYTITDQTNPKKASRSTTTSSSVKRIIKRGNYQILVSQNETSYFKVFHTSAIFNTVKITASLKPENNRSFVGDNPGSCMQYNQGILISNNCGGSFASTKTHIPATASLPTYTLSDSSILGTTESFVSTREGNFILILQPISEDDTMMHILYRLESSANTAAKPVKVLELPQLDTAKTYTVQHYKDGFLFYNNTNTTAYYFASLSSSQSVVELHKPKDSSLSLGQIDSSSNNLYALYENIEDSEKNGSKSLKSELVVQDGSSVKNFSFKHAYSSVYACGKNLVCLIEGDRMDIYDISANKAIKKYSVATAKNVISANDTSCIVVTSTGLLELDTADMSGHYAYSFGNYTYASAITTDNGYLLSVSDYKHKEVALLVSKTSGANDSIDKKVYELEKLPEVKNVSLYKNYLYIAPDFGDQEYNQTDRLFEYNPSVKAAAKGTIKSEISRLNIDTTKYSVISTEN